MQKWTKCVIIKLRMGKSLKISSKNLSIQHPKWFFEVLHAAQAKPKSIELLFEKGAQISPSGSALLGLLGRELVNLGVQLKFNRKVSGVVDEFPHHGQECSIDFFEDAIKPMFFERFIETQKNISDERAFDLQLLFSELTQNAKDHSGSERYCVFLSPTEVGVFDLGVSIPAKLEQKFSFKSDVDAIEFSLKEGVTTRRLRSGGFGLYYTLDMLKKSGGQLYIASRHGQIRRYLKNKKIDRKTLDPRIPGTLIYCRLGEIEHE
jgi:hypothetical protein